MTGGVLCPRGLYILRGRLPRRDYVWGTYVRSPVIYERLTRYIIQCECACLCQRAGGVELSFMAQLTAGRKHAKRAPYR